MGSRLCVVPRCVDVRLTADEYGVTQDLPVGTDDSVWAGMVSMDSVAGSWTSEGQCCCGVVGASDGFGVERGL